MDPLGEDVGAEQQPPVEHGGIVADPHLPGRRLGQGPAEPVEKGEFAAQQSLRRTVGWDRWAS